MGYAVVKLNDLLKQRGNEVFYQLQFADDPQMSQSLQQHQCQVVLRLEYRAASRMSPRVPSSADPSPLGHNSADTVPKPNTGLAH